MVDCLSCNIWASTWDGGRQGVSYKMRKVRSGSNPSLPVLFDFCSSIFLNLGNDFVECRFGMFELHTPRIGTSMLGGDFVCTIVEAVDCLMSLRISCLWTRRRR